MNTLFPIQPDFPNGFSYVPDFISVPEELHLYKEISKVELKKMIFHGYEANRKTASFGYDYSFENGGLKKGKEIPAAFNFLIERVAQEISIKPGNFAELLITEYPVGSVINWHRDAPPLDIVAGISLLADCKFRLRPQDKTKQTRSSIISFPVKRRSLYFLQDEARTNWQHSISPVKEVRFSITLRTLRGNLK
jgi:alkylated DNA repair dioxygenase AlkB